MNKAMGKSNGATGALIGDESKNSEERSELTKGTTKDKLSEAKDLLE